MCLLLISCCKFVFVLIHCRYGGFSIKIFEVRISVVSVELDTHSLVVKSLVREERLVYGRGEEESIRDQVPVN